MRPVFREIAVWWERRQEVRLTRQLGRTLIIMALLTIVLVVPWQRLVSIPAVQRAKGQSWIYTPAAARLAAVFMHDGARVEEEEVLAVLDAPELDHAIAQSQRRVAMLEALILRRTASAETATTIHILRQQLVSERTRLDGLEERRARLVLRSPFAGVIRDTLPGLISGRWLAEDEALAMVVRDGGLRLVGYVAEADRDRITEQGTGTFYPQDRSHSPFPIRVVMIADINSDTIDYAPLAAPFGGLLAARITHDGRIVPAQGLYRVELEPLEPLPNPPRLLPGTARIEGDARSLLGRLAHHAGAVLIRESGL